MPTAEWLGILVTCTRCGKRHSRGESYHRVCGWARPRTEGGINAVKIRTSDYTKWVCAKCIADLSAAWRSSYHATGLVSCRRCPAVLRAEYMWEYVGGWSRPRTQGGDHALSLPWHSGYWLSYGCLEQHRSYVEILKHPDPHEPAVPTMADMPYV